MRGGARRSLPRCGSGLGIGPHQCGAGGLVPGWQEVEAGSGGSPGGVTSRGLRRAGIPWFPALKIKRKKWWVYQEVSLHTPRTPSTFLRHLRKDLVVYGWHIQALCPLLASSLDNSRLQRSKI